MDVVTVSREMGSLGYEVAELVARQLGYRLVWRELVNQAARRAGAPEVALAEIDELGLLRMCPSPSACTAYHRAMRHVIADLAQEGNVVIVGRAGQTILKGNPNVMHVRIIAPLRVRAERVAQKQGISRRAALAQVQASDQSRRNYIRRFYREDWNDPSLYDMTINTARMTPERAAELICVVARERSQAGVPAA